MAKLTYLPGNLSTIDEIIVLNSSKTDGSRRTGLLFNTASLVGHFKREGATDYTAATMVDISTLGTFDATNDDEIGFKQSPAKTGSYEIHLADNIMATGVDWVSIILEGASNMAPVHIQYQTNAVDVQTKAEAALVVHWTTAMTEAYAADGTPPTPEQLFYMIWSRLSHISISSTGTVLSAKKLDGTTEAMAFSLDKTPTAATKTITRTA